MTAGLGEFCEHEEKYIQARGALQQILPTQIANNIATTEKSENQLQVLDFIEVEQSKTQFGVELGNSCHELKHATLFEWRCDMKMNFSGTTH